MMPNIYPSVAAVRVLLWKSKLSKSLPVSTHKILQNYGCHTPADFFVVELRNFCRGQIGLIFAGHSAQVTMISLTHTSRFFVATNHVEAWGRVIQNQDGTYSADAAKFQNLLCLPCFFTDDKDAS